MFPAEGCIYRTQFALYCAETNEICSQQWAVTVEPNVPYIVLEQMIYVPSRRLYL